MSEQGIEVEVAYAKPDKQVVLKVTGQSGMTVEAAIARSGILEEFPEIEPATMKVGVFGKAAKRQDPLADGDRVEIYRPLIADPKEARKRRAAEGKVMRKGGGKRA